MALVGCAGTPSRNTHSKLSFFLLLVLPPVAKLSDTAHTGWSPGAEGRVEKDESPCRKESGKYPSSLQKYCYLKLGQPLGGCEAKRHSKPKSRKGRFFF